MKIDMNNKKTIRVTDKAFHLENNVLVLGLDVVNYDLTGKTVTAIFEPSQVEAGPFEPVGNVVNMPIIAGMAKPGVNYIQLNFRWGGGNLEQSGKMIWTVEKSLEDIDILTQLIGEYRGMLGNENDRVFAEGERDRAEQARESVFAEIMADANEAEGNLNQAIEDGNAIHGTLLTDIENAGTADRDLSGTIGDADTIYRNLSDKVDDADEIYDKLTDEDTGAIPLANEINDTLTNETDGTIKQATNINATLEGNIEDAGTINNTLSEEDGTIEQAMDIYEALADEETGAINRAETAKSDLEDAISTGGQIFEDVATLKGLRVEHSDTEPTDTPFWYDTSDTTEIVRRDTNGQV